MYLTKKFSIIIRLLVLMLSWAMMQPVLADEMAKKPLGNSAVCSKVYFNCQAKCRQLTDTKKVMACMNNECSQKYKLCNTTGETQSVPSYMMLLFHLPL
jgi:hypothetical protein